MRILPVFCRARAIVLRDNLSALFFFARLHFPLPTIPHHSLVETAGPANPQTPPPSQRRVLCFRFFAASFSHPASYAFRKRCVASFFPLSLLRVPRQRPARDLLAGIPLPKLNRTVGMQRGTRTARGALAKQIRALIGFTVSGSSVSPSTLVPAFIESPALSLD